MKIALYTLAALGIFTAAALVFLVGIGLWPVLLFAHSYKR